MIRPRRHEASLAAVLVISRWSLRSPAWSPAAARKAVLPVRLRPGIHLHSRLWAAPRRWQAPADRHRATAPPHVHRRRRPDARSAAPTDVGSPGAPGSRRAYAKLVQAMKRFKAAIIGGSGYGGAEMIRRLLIHPEVELVRVASIDHVGEPLGAVHPNLTGAPTCVFEDLPPAEAAQGCDVALLALPHKVTAQQGARAHRRAASRSSTCRATSGCATPASYEKFYGAKHPHPELLGHVRLRPARAEPRARSAGRAYVASPGCFATTIELGAAAARARRPARRRRRARRRHHRLVGLRASRRRRARITRCARATSRPTSRSSTSTCRRSCRRWRRPARRASSCASCRSRRRSRAASSPPASSSCRPARRREAIARAVRRALRARAVRALVARPAARGRRGRGLATTSRSASRSARPTGGKRTRDAASSAHRQPDQGRRRPGDPEHEPDARPRREGCRSRTPGRWP